MKLIAQLAYSQLKVNRSRTILTLIGIMLSTALITAVCSFVASGNAFASGLYGGEYSDATGTSDAILIVPAIILGAIIVLMSIVVVSNVFSVSAGERTAQFGILKSVGATKKQITEVIMYESIFLSAVGIPLGLACGLLLAYAGVGVANHLLGEINSLVNMMIHELIIVIDFVVAWQALALAAVVSFLTVLLSAWLPARKAAKITAIDSIRRMGEVVVSANQLHTSPVTERLFGFEGTLAAKNMKRSKRNFRASVTSLTVGIVLFITISFVSEQVGQIEESIFPEIDSTVMVDYVSVREYAVNENTGKEEPVILNPISSETGEAITRRLREYGDTAVIGLGDEMETYRALVPREMISQQMLAVSFDGIEQQVYETSAEIITVDSENYAKLCEKAGVPIGSNILLNYYDYNDNGKMVPIVPFDGKTQGLRYQKADGSLTDMPIHGVLAKTDLPGEFFGPGTNVVRVIVPQGETRGYTWYSAPADIDGYMAYANEIMRESFSRDPDSRYMESGFTTRVFKTQDYMRVMNIAIVLISVFVYCFVALLVLIGLTNVIITMSTNVRIRAKEFAVLQSVGMTAEGLKRMLNLESIMCSAKALIIGLPLAFALTIIINFSIRQMLPVAYHLPWTSAAWCVIAVFAITWITMRYSASMLRGKNIVETIRSEG